jgi:hypothetical protein
MSPSDVCIATISFARDEPEAALIRRALQRLSTAGMQVVVADGGSPAPLVEIVRALPRVTLVTPGTPGLVPQVKAALRAAAAFETRFVLYAEGDKADFFERHLDAFVARAPADDGLGIVVAGRTDASFATFPPLQRYCETALAHLTGEITRVPGDYSFGPFTIDRRLLREMDHVHDTLGWGWRHFMFAIAALRGFGVAHVTGDYECPPGQREEGERERMHRLSQLSQSVDGLVLAMKAAKA